MPEETKPTEVTSKKTGKGLEQRVADAYRRMRARVEHNVELGGNQIDIYVQMQMPDRGVHRIAVEAKDWSRTVGVDVVNKFALIVENLRNAKLADEGVIVSASGFSKEARNAAKTYSIRLEDLDDLDVVADQVQMGMLPLTAYISHSSPLQDTLPSEYRQILDLLSLVTIEEFEERRQALNLTEEQISFALRRVAREGNDFRLRKSAVRKLGEKQYYPIDLNVDALIEVILKDKEEPDVQLEAIRALGSLRSVRGLSVLGDELKRLDQSQRASGTYRGDPDFASDILEAIRRIDERRAFECLVKIDKSIEDKKIRDMVVRVIREMKYPSEEAGL